MDRFSLFGSVSLSGTSGSLDGHVSKRVPLALLAASEAAPARSAVP